MFLNEVGPSHVQAGTGTRQGRSGLGSPLGRSRPAIRRPEFIENANSPVNRRHRFWEHPVRGRTGCSEIGQPGSPANWVFPTRTTRFAGELGVPESVNPVRRRTGCSGIGQPGSRASWSFPNWIAQIPPTASRPRPLADPDPPPTPIPADLDPRQPRLPPAPSARRFRPLTYIYVYILYV
jgi:hypothetical protein